MRKKIKTVLAAAVVVMAVVVVAGLVASIVADAPRLQVLPACEGADRVVVNLNVYPEEQLERGNVPRLPTFEIKSAGEAAGRE